MEEILEKLVQLAKGTGFITWAQLNDTLPSAFEERLSAELLNQLLDRLSHQGISVIDDKPMPERPPISFPRYYRVPEFEKYLRSFGVEFNDCVCRTTDVGKVVHARLKVPGNKALEIWQTIRSQWQQIGFWPTIFKDRYDQNSDVKFDELVTLTNGCLVDWVNTEEQARLQKERLIEANRVDVYQFFLDRSGHLTPQQVTDFASKNLDVSTPSQPSVFDPTKYRVPIDPLTNQPLDWVEIQLDVLNDPSEWFLVRSFGGWNESPTPPQQLAIHRYWHSQFETEVVSCGGDWYEMHVRRPPQTRLQALNLIREMTAFGEENIFERVGDVEELITLAMTSPYWFFWWD